MILEDIFLLLEDRNLATINKFIKNYLDGFEANLDSFEYPAFSEESEFETENITEMIEYLCYDDKRSYHFYFNSLTPNVVKQVMLFFNSDGSVLLGLGVEEKNTTFYVDKLLEDFDSPFILICNFVLPPDNKMEFKLKVKTLNS